MDYLLIDYWTFSLKNRGDEIECKEGWKKGKGKEKESLDGMQSGGCVCVCARTHACVCLCVCKLSAILLNNPDAITLHLHADLIRKR